MKTAYYYVVIMLLFGAFACTTSCNKKGGCEELDLPAADLMMDYHKIYKPQHATQTGSGSFAIFLDYSSGMRVAFADKKTEAFYNLFINSLAISKVDFYEVNKDKIDKIENLEKPELYKKIKDSKKFVGMNAPLDLAVTDIMKLNTESVLITDGELWKNGERDDPWAREPFTNWLKAGNTLELFVTDHIDAGKTKHLFYIFFIPAHEANLKESIAKVFKFYLDNSSEAKQLTYTHFTFSPAHFHLKQEYPTAQTGGVNENAELDPESYLNYGDTLGFEYQEYFLPWKDMVKYIYEATDDNGTPIAGGAPLLSKLYLESNAMEFYTIDEIGIRVYDVRADYDKFKLVAEAKRNPPTYETDETGKKILDEENKPIIKCTGQYGAYDEVTGKLLIDTVFKAGELKTVEEVFSFDSKSFENNLKEQGKGEIIIKLHPNFNGSQISEEAENLHRIDIYLKKVTANTSNPNLEKFIWDGKQVAKNRSLYNSILGALNEANPEGKVIYTFYLKTQPNDYQK